MKSDTYLYLILRRYKRFLNNVHTPWQTRRENEKITKMYCLYLLLKREEEQAVRQFWVRPIFREERRILQGLSDNLIVEMANVDPEKYFDFFRMDVETFNELLTLLEPHISKQTAVRRPIPARTRLEICLRYLASGDSLSSLSYAFRVAQNTISKIIAETCQAIWDVLAERVFPALTEEMWQQKAADFEEITNYPNCIGCIDGKHVTVQAPPNSGLTYYNYKGQHSIVLLAITDANGLLTIVDIGAEGRRSDGGILIHSDVGRALSNSELNLPAPRLLEVNGPLLPYVLLGDEAFALTNYMMRPYPRRCDLDFSRKVFNYRLSRARRTVECAFGVLSARWIIYRKDILATVEHSIKIIQATVCLHNYLTAKELAKTPEERQYSLESTDDVPRNNQFRDLQDQNARNNCHNNATQIRDNFKTYFMTTGAVDWQWEKALRNNF